MRFNNWLGGLSDSAFQRLKWILSTLSAGLVSAFIIALEV